MKYTDLKEILKWSQDKLFENLKASPQGYSQAEAQRLYEELGPNEIEQRKRESPLIGFINVLINPFNLVLMVVIAVTFVSDILLAKEKDYLTITILIVIVLISTLISFIQDERSNAASEKLLNMVSNTTAALRDGQFIEIPIDELVLGDIVRLSAGDIIPPICELFQPKTCSYPKRL